MYMSGLSSCVLSLVRDIWSKRIKKKRVSNVSYIEYVHKICICKSNKEKQSNISSVYNECLQYNLLTYLLFLIFAANLLLVEYMPYKMPRLVLYLLEVSTMQLRHHCLVLFFFHYHYYYYFGHATWYFY